MRNNLVLLACVVVSSATAYGPKWHEIDDSYTFERYVRDFQKRCATAFACCVVSHDIDSRHPAYSYETDEERDLRRLVFEDRLRKIIDTDGGPTGK